MKFQDMSLPQKRMYISKMETIRKGFMTPGMLVDDMIDKRIQDLDKKFKDINFGQQINHQTFEFFTPKRLDKITDVTEFRKWKIREIILKQHQFEDRINRFKKNLDSFKVNKDRI